MFGICAEAEIFWKLKPRYTLCFLATINKLHGKKVSVERIANVPVIERLSALLSIVTEVLPLLPLFHYLLLIKYHRDIRTLFPFEPHQECPPLTMFSTT